MSDTFLEVVRTRQLDIVDAAGEVRVQAGVSPQGAFVSLFDANKALRAALYQTNADGPTLQFWGKDGAQRLSISANDDGNSGVSLHDSAGRLRLSILVADETSVTPAPENPTEVVTITLRDASGQPRLNIGFRDERGTVSIIDKAGVYRAALDVDRTGDPAVILNKQGL